MAYLVILITANPPFDQFDIISWRPEGSQSFGLKMLQHPNFRVVHVSDMSDADAEAFCATQPGDWDLNPNLLQRAFKFDINALPTNIKNRALRTRDALSTKWDGTKYTTPEDFTCTRAQALAVKVSKL